MEHTLHPWVVFMILPVFALANVGLNPVTLGIAMGLFMGKPIGITLFSYMAARAGIASLPENVRWSHISGTGMLGESALPSRCL